MTKSCRMHCHAALPLPSSKTGCLSITGTQGCFSDLEARQQQAWKAPHLTPHHVVPAEVDIAAVGELRSKERRRQSFQVLLRDEGCHVKQLHHAAAMLVLHLKPSTLPMIRQHQSQCVLRQGLVALISLNEAISSAHDINNDQTRG